MESSSSARRLWTQIEDDALTELVNAHGSDWNLIANKLSLKLGEPSRNSKQCRQRWSNNLDPDLRKSDWPQEEAQALFRHHQQYGNQWMKIAALMPGRSDNCIKNPPKPQNPTYMKQRVQNFFNRVSSIVDFWPYGSN